MFQFMMMLETIDQVRRMTKEMIEKETNTEMNIETEIEIVIETGTEETGRKMTGDVIVTSSEMIETQETGRDTTEKETETEMIGDQIRSKVTLINLLSRRRNNSEVLQMKTRR